MKNGIDYSNEELVLTVPGGEYYNDDTNTFFEVKEQTIRLKHSLVSISKWEAKYQRPFIDEKKPPTREEMLDYIRFMTITQNVDRSIYNRLTSSHHELINKYINSKMCGTSIGDDKEQSKQMRGRYKKPISSELIYYWMTEYNIPFECRKWHFGRLMMLIRVCGIKKAQMNNAAKGKKGKTNSGRDYRSINAANKRKYNTRG